ncbi:LuxR family transcriptional regulator [Methylobacterium sp. Leaf361]|uniref:LuxR family transcriptional regulator n=1 Tax=Methylobacterium sp. Leaf361 TaxID=1736352 RepID=UPI0006F70775|nr:LuxR family transcriptional regulator [Methylobacterium sp. Leaf361]KQS64032.1 LuxR family transcriptional regulator [Methylobacterium sp. Leaf361]
MAGGLSIRQTAFDVVHRLRKAATDIDVYTELRRCGAIFGYEAFLIAGLPRSPHENLFDCSLISGWPPEWGHRYQDQRHMHVDPVISHIRGTTDPFLWQEAVDARGTPQGLIVMDEARAFKLNQGFCVPFHQIDGTEAGVSFGGEQVRLSSDERAALHLVAIYAMSTAKAIARRRGALDEDDTPPSPLTGREAECLRWSSAGKSAWEIGVILSISTRTVEQHLASAARKLNAVSRTQAVAEALRRRIID